ncbi:MAG TPA: hypothetical protein VF501_08690 [Thiobacillus sp.]
MAALVYSAAMLRKKLRRPIAFLCAVILMATQFAVAAYACPAQRAAEAANVPPPDCVRNMEHKGSPLCKAHCNPSAQSNQVPAVDLLPFAGLGFWIVPPLDTIDRFSSRDIRGSPMWLADASPPLRIRYKVLRI